MASQDFTAAQVLTAAQMDKLVNAIDGYSTTVTAAGTTVLTTDSNYQQVFTGTTTQTVTLPVTSTMGGLGQKFRVINDSTGIVTVQSSGANTVYAVPAGVTVDFICILLTGTTAASWLADYPATATTSFVGAIAYRGSTQALTASTVEAILCTSEEIDTNSFHDTGSNTSRMTIPSGKDGKYSMTISALFETGSYYFLYPYKNGAIIANGLWEGKIASLGTGGSSIYITATIVVTGVATDYFEWMLLQDGAGKNLTRARYSFTYLGA